MSEEREEEELSVQQQELMSGLTELYQRSRGTDDKRAKKREKALFHINAHSRSPMKVENFVKV